jgi:SpoVK/Ycf46/Vps4 family AAA+-type ATPase
MMEKVFAAGEAASLRTGLLALDLKLRAMVEALRDEISERARDPFYGLYISDADVERMLASTPASFKAEQIPLGEAGHRVSRLALLADTFQLDPLERDALLICLAPEVDPRYERLFGYLQDDATRRRPTVDLLLRILVPPGQDHLGFWQALSPHGRLFRLGLLSFSEEAASRWPLLSRPLRVDERIVEYLLGSDLLDVRLAPFCTLLPVPAEDADAEPPNQAAAGLARMILPDPGGTAGPIIYLHGPPGAGKAAAARSLCQAAGMSMLLVDLSLLPAYERRPSLLALAAREALLQRAVLVLQGFDPTPGDDPDAQAARNELRRTLSEHSGAVLLLGEPRWEPATWIPRRTALRVELSAPGPAARLRLWQRHLDGQLPHEKMVDLAARYRVDVDAIRAVSDAAHSRALSRGDESVSADDFQVAAKAIASPPLDGLAKRIDPRYGWDDIILPPDTFGQLKEMCARARHHAVVLERWGFGRKHARRAGFTALFVGQPGTGKTMSAEVLAGELGLDLYRIDLSGVVSKYIGETEKNLERVFRAADQGDALLLFDEADALFGKRSEVRDAHDRYANVEVAYLLQRLEAYEGVAILTSNLRGNIDEAFMRRLDFVLEFPMPEEPERLAIWRRALPSEAPLADDVDLAFLARKFKLAGGHIRNIALAAAFFAAADGGSIAMRHLVRGTRREHQKLGKLLGIRDFENHADLMSD